MVAAKMTQLIFEKLGGQVNHVDDGDKAGNNSPSETKEYLKAGMQAVIDKPLTKEKAQYFLSFCES